MSHKKYMLLRKKCTINSYGKDFLVGYKAMESFLMTSKNSSHVCSIAMVELVDFCDQKKKQFVLMNCLC